MELLPYSDSLLFSLIAYSILAAAYSGWGRLLFRLMHIDPEVPDRAFTRIWLGWAVATLLLLTAHFFKAISFSVSIPLFCIGVLLNLLKRPKKLSAVALPGWRIVLFWGTLIAVSVWVASWAMLTPQVYDSGLYHFNSIRWINEYPVTPGLGNLHIRLSYNQAFFLYAASLNIHPMLPYGHHLANSFLILLLLAECLYHLIVRTGRSAESPRSPDVSLSFGFLVLAVFLTVTSGVSSPATDTAVAVLEYLLFWQMARLLDDRAAGRSLLFRLSVITVLAAAMLATKLSLLVYAATAVGLSLLVAGKELRGSSREGRRPVLVSMAVGALLVVAWICRGYVLSGYPLLPSSVGGIGFDWSVPAGTVDGDKRWVTSWARFPGARPDEVLASWAWLGPWSRAMLTQTTTVVYPLVATLIAAAASAVLNAVPALRKRTGELWPLLLLPVPVLAGLGFWFLTAPDVRFAQALFFLLPVSFGYLFLRGLPFSGKPGIIWIVCVSFAIYGGVAFWMVKRTSAILRVPESGYSAIPQAPLQVQTTESGLQVLVPTTGDQCWDSPLPCTPYFNKHLRLRGGTLREGFTVR
jgi:hypothetical protein